MKEKTMKILLLVLLVLLAAGVTAYAAANYGSKDDPLITKSYLDEVVKPQLEGEMQSKLESAASDILRSAPGEFTLVKLGSGAELHCATGCQILPVSGSVTALGAFADSTAGAAIAADAAMSANHLYLATEEGGVRADGEGGVLVSGSYRVE